MARILSEVRRSQHGVRAEAVRAQGPASAVKSTPRSAGMPNRTTLLSFSAEVLTSSCKVSIPHDDACQYLRGRYCRS